MNEQRLFPKANCSLVSNSRAAVAAKRHLFRVPFQEKKPLFVENNGHFESTTHNIQHLSAFASHSARRKWKNNEIAGRVGGVYFIWCICRSEIYGECRGREPLTDLRELVRQRAFKPFALGGGRYQVAHGQRG